MGASQSSQPPPSRNHSRHGNVDNKHKQRASSVSAPMKTPLPPIAIEKTESGAAPSIISDPPRSVPAPSIAVPIPVKKKPTSLPASGENSYIDNHRDADLLHKHIKELDVEDTEEEMDETEVRAKFGIAWVASDDFAADEKVGGPKFPLEIVWNGSPNDKEVYVLGTFTERKALKLKKNNKGQFVIVVDAEPGGHRFRFIVDGESRTSPDYRLATDHQNIVVNYLDHVKREAPSEATTDYEPYQFSGRRPPPKDIWTTDIPPYLTARYFHSSSPASSASSGSSASFTLLHESPELTPAQLKGHILNVTVAPGEKKEDSSVTPLPSHAVLGHLGIRTTTSDGLLATTITMRYKHKV